MRGVLCFLTALSFMHYKDIYNNYKNKLFYTFFQKKFTPIYNNIISLCECWPVGVASWAAGGWRSRHRCGAYCWPTGCRVRTCAKCVTN